MGAGDASSASIDHQNMAFFFLPVVICHAIFTNKWTAMIKSDVFYCWFYLIIFFARQSSAPGSDIVQPPIRFKAAPPNQINSYSPFQTMRCAVKTPFFKKLCHNLLTNLVPIFPISHSQGGFARKAETPHAPTRYRLSNDATNDSKN